MRKINFIILILTVILISAKTTAQDYCGAISIDSAAYKYQIGRFDECIESLTICLNTKGGYNSEQKIHAFHLLAKCYYEVDLVDKADSVVEELLLRQENFEPDLNDPEKLKNKILSLRLNIVSSVSKRIEDIRLAPATSIVITQEEILQRGYADLIDFLKDIPGFDISIYYGQLYANAYQRGYRTNNTDKTLLLVDGVEENDLWSNFADISQQYPITNIKRVEIVYGPASTMYGPNAFSGVINIITKEPSDFIKEKNLFGVHASTGIGSYNTRYVDASTAFRKGIFSFNITARVYHSDRPNLSSQSLWDYDPSTYDIDNIYHYRKNLSILSNGRQYLNDNNMPDTSPFYLVPNDDTIALTNMGIAEAKRLNKALYNYNGFDFTKFINPSQSSYLSAKINVGDFSIGFASWAKTEGIGTTFTDFIASVNGTRWRPAHQYLFFKYSKRINEKLLFTTFINYRVHTIRNGSRITSIKDYSLVGGLELKDLVNARPAYWLTTYYYEQSSQFRSEFKLLYHPNKYFSLISGVELRNSLLQGYYLTDTFSPLPQVYGSYPNNQGNQYEVNDIGIYVQGNYLTKNGFNFTVGGRLDYNQIRRSDGLGYNLSPRIVVDYIKKGWVFKAIASKGIQNISNYTKFNDVNLVPNPSLTSESIYNYEVSASNKISEAVTADIDFYYSVINNVVRPIHVSAIKLQNYNLAAAQIKGIQANLYYKSVNKKWHIIFNYSYTHSLITKDIDPNTDLVYNVHSKTSIIAPHKANAIINYSFLKYFNINLRTNYIGKRRIGSVINYTTFEDYFIENITFSTVNIVNRTSLQFVCNNVFNKSYYTPGLRFEAIRGPNQIFQMKRNFAIKLNYDF